MKESNKGSKLDSIKLVYNEKSKRIVANLITVVDGVKVHSKTIDNVEVIKVLLDALVKQSKMSVAKLIDKGLINVDDRLINEGVIVLDSDKEYKKYLFDKETGSFVSNRITRLERVGLGTLRKDNSLDSEETKSSETILEGTFDGSTTPVVEPTLPEETEEKEIETSPVEEETHTHEDGAIDIHEASEIVSESKKEKKNKCRNLKIFKRGLALLGVAALVLVGSNLFKGKDKNKTGSDEGNQLPDEPSRNEMQGGSIENPSIDGVTFEEPHEFTLKTPNYDYSNLGSIVSEEDIEAQMQSINEGCVSGDEIALYNLVVESDKSTIKAISNARNDVLGNRANIDDLIDNYVRYVFEGSTVFNGNVVKAYDYLTPYAKYIVLVSGQTMLPRSLNYNYSTMNGVYTYEDLIDSFDDYVNQTTQELFGNRRTY